MTETTRTQTMSPPGGPQQSSPEFRFAMDAWRGLRRDLFHDAFAYRPLLPLKLDGQLTGRLRGDGVPAGRRCE